MSSPPADCAALDAAYTSPRTRAARRAIAEWRRRSMRRRTRCITSQVTIHTPSSRALLERLVTHYDVKLVAHLVGPPSDAAAPERVRLEAFARKDAATSRPATGSSSRAETAPDAADVSSPRACSPPRSAGRFASAAAAVGARSSTAIARVSPTGGSRELPATKKRVLRSQRVPRSGKRRGHYSPQCSGTAASCTGASIAAPSRAPLSALGAPPRAQVRRYSRRGRSESRSLRRRASVSSSSASCHSAALQLHRARAELRPRAPPSGRSGAATRPADGDARLRCRARSSVTSCSTPARG